MVAGRYRKTYAPSEDEETSTIPGRRKGPQRFGMPPLLLGEEMSDDRLAPHLFERCQVTHIGVVLFGSHPASHLDPAGAYNDLSAESQLQMLNANPSQLDKSAEHQFPHHLRQRSAIRLIVIHRYSHTSSRPRLLSSERSDSAHPKTSPATCPRGALQRQIHSRPLAVFRKSGEGSPPDSSFLPATHQPSPKKPYLAGRPESLPHTCGNIHARECRAPRTMKNQPQGVPSGRNMLRPYATRPDHSPDPGNKPIPQNGLSGKSDIPFGNGSE